MFAPAIDAVPPPTPPSSIISANNSTGAPNGNDHSQVTSVGNFLLSSCPGKKVRLSGPVKGRGAICRDLRRDLERIQGLGVGCVIWLVSFLALFLSFNGSLIG